MANSIKHVQTLLQIFGHQNLKSTATWSYPQVIPWDSWYLRASFYLLLIFYLISVFERGWPRATHSTSGKKCHRLNFWPSHPSTDMPTGMDARGPQWMEHEYIQRAADLPFPSRGNGGASVVCPFTPRQQGNLPAGHRLQKPTWEQESHLP